MFDISNVSGHLGLRHLEYHVPDCHSYIIIICVCMEMELAYDVMTLSGQCCRQLASAHL